MLTKYANRYVCIGDRSRSAEEKHSVGVMFRFQLLLVGFVYVAS